MNVLIVDDDKLARKGLVAIMDWKKYGFEVVGDVQNGRKALEFLRNHPVDIVFTDIDMPEIDGLELMQTCRDGHAEEENQEKVEELNRRWMHTRWIFSEKEFEDLCQKTKEISLRSAERIFVKSFHNIQLLSDGEGEFPSMDTVEEMLDWVHRWREHIYEESLSSSQKNDISAFAAVIKYVDGHIGENLRSEDVAERIGMSRSYFSTRFKEMTGETFHQYVIHRKMKTAAEWIEEGKKSITRIAVELGYDNFHYFAKVFAREHGCTPSEYRKESKNV